MPQVRTMSVKQTKRSIEWHEPRSKKLTRPEGAKGFSKSQVLHVLVLAFGGNPTSAPRRRDGCLCLHRQN